MTLRRTLVGTFLLLAFSAWFWCRPCGKQAHARPADANYAHAEAEDEECAGGTHDEQMYRFRTNQPRHWRHVMIGGR